MHPSVAEGIVTLQEKSTCANLIGQWSVKTLDFANWRTAGDIYDTVLAFFAWTDRVCPHDCTANIAQTVVPQEFYLIYH